MRHKTDPPSQKSDQKLPAQEKKFYKGRTEQKRHRVVFVTDSKELRIERRLLPIALGNSGLDINLSVLPYGDFLENVKFQADVLILRSSLVFFHSADERQMLCRSIALFKARNPDSVVTVFAIGYDGSLKDLGKNGLIDSLHPDWQAGTDIPTVGDAIKLLERRRSE